LLNSLGLTGIHRQPYSGPIERVDFDLHILEKSLSDFQRLTYCAFTVSIIRLMIYAIILDSQ